MNYLTKVIICISKTGKQYEIYKVIKADNPDDVCNVVYNDWHDKPEYTFRVERITAEYEIPN